MTGNGKKENAESEIIAIIVKQTNKRDETITEDKKRKEGDTYQLNLSQVTLPPKVFLPTVSKGRHAVIRVHDDMNQRVQACCVQSCNSTKTQ